MDVPLIFVRTVCPFGLTTNALVVEHATPILATTEANFIVTCQKMLSNKQATGYCDEDDVGLDASDPVSGASAVD